jgi:hypothetical protein
MENPEKSTHGNRIVSWILCGFLLLVALFFMLFSFDVFSMEGTFIQKMGGFFIHNIFTIGMLLILWLAWKHEHLAGFLLIALSVFMIIFFGGPSHIRGGTWMMISLPFVVGILFLTNYYLIKTKK